MFIVKKERKCKVALHNLKLLLSGPGTFAFIDKHKTDMEKR